MIQQHMIDEFMKQDFDNKIAVVGMGMRFPNGVKSPEDFYEILKQGIDCVTEVPKERWDRNSYYDSQQNVYGTLASCKGGYLKEVDGFDADFFQISEKEARAMDPQQRILLEVVWEALEEGGHVPSSLRESDTGVFIGSFCQDYYMMNGDPSHSEVNSFTATGITNTLLANRISYVFDWTGPSMTIDTACSSSLTALNQACESLRLKKCDMAVAGGVMLMLQPNYGIIETQAGFLAKDGKCKTFDEAADGYVRGEGAGVVILKRLEDAIADGDTIEGVILASGINQDGHTDTVTKPNGDSQQCLMRRTLSQAGVIPEFISYVEAHGTGTKVGDVIEAQAIGEVYASTERTLTVGSVKTNLGHLESAAGIAGFIKVLLMMRYQTIVPHLNLNHLNKDIAFDEQNIHVATTLKAWNPEVGIRIAAVNSFGFGGSNAHVIVMEPLKEWNCRKYHQHESRYHMMQISANSKASLQRLRDQYAKKLMKEDWNEDELNDIAYSSFATREVLQHRYAYVYQTKEELINLLTEKVIKGCHIGSVYKKPQGLVFVYSGMGPQWYGMGRQLYQKHAFFHERMKQCIQIFYDLSGKDLESELLCSKELSQVDQVEIGQPLHVILQIALTDLFRKYGIEPAITIGHSAGEMAAYYAAGIYSREETIQIAYHRSLALSFCKQMGGMLAVDCSVEEIMPYLDAYEGKVFIACINATRGITLSGVMTCLKELQEQLQQNEIHTKSLPGTIPYHSPMLAPIKETLLDSLSRVLPSYGRIPVMSTVTGSLVRGNAIDQSYWYSNVSNTVQFHQGIDGLIQMGYTQFVEIGAHPVLLNYIARHESAKDKLLVPTLRREEDEMFRITDSLAKLFVNGYEFCVKAWFLSGRKVSLPTYEWEHKSYWMEPEEMRRKRLGIKDGSLLGVHLDGGGHRFESRVSCESFPFLKEHKVLHQMMYPAAAYLETYFEAANVIFGSGNYRLLHLSLKKAIRFEEHKRVTIQTQVHKENNRVISYYQDNSKDYEECASVQIKKVQSRRHGSRKLNELRSKMEYYLCKEQVYQTLASLQFNYEGSFQRVVEAWYQKDVCLARIQTGVDNQELIKYSCHLSPQCMDACFQALLIADSMENYEEFYIPVAIESIEIWEKPKEYLWAWARLVYRDKECVIGDIDLYDESGIAIGMIKGMRREAIDDTTHLKIDEWRYHPVWKPVNLGIGMREETGKSKSKVSCLILSKSLSILQSLEQELMMAGIDVCVMTPEQYVQTPMIEVREHLIYVKDYSSVPELNFAQSEAEAFLMILKDVIRKDSSSKVWLVTKGMFVVESEDCIGNPMDAGLYGIMREYGQQERQSGYGGCIDFAFNESSEHISSWIMKYIFSNPKQQQIAIRGESVYERKITLDRKNGELMAYQATKEDAFLIVGAYGAIGRCITEALFESGVSRFVFLTSHDLTKDRLDWIQKLEGKGVIAEHYTVDITNEVELNQCIAVMIEKVCLTGVVIASGIVHDVLLENMTLEEYRRVVEVKAMGVWNLHKALPKDLEYFLVCSSIASDLPGLGQANYAAANCIIDAICEYRRQQGLPAVSMNWGPWSIGMVRSLGLQDYMEKAGWTLIRPEFGKKLFFLAMQEEKSRIILTRMNHNCMNHIEASLIETEVSFEDHQKKGIFDSLRKMNREERVQKTEEIFLQLVDLVGTNKPTAYDRTRTLTYYGIDSLGAMFLREQISAHFEVNILVSELIGSLEIGQVIDVIISRMDKVI